MLNLVVNLSIYVHFLGTHPCHILYIGDLNDFMEDGNKKDSVIRE